MPSLVGCTPVNQWPGHPKATDRSFQKSPTIQPKLQNAPFGGLLINPAGGTALHQHQPVARHQELNVCHGATGVNSQPCASFQGKQQQKQWGQQQHLGMPFGPVVGAAVSSSLDHQCNPCVKGHGCPANANPSWLHSGEPMAWSPKSHGRIISENPNNSAKTTKCPTWRPSNKSSCGELHWTNINQLQATRN